SHCRSKNRAVSSAMRRVPLDRHWNAPFRRSFDDPEKKYSEAVLGIDNAGGNYLATPFSSPALTCRAMRAQVGLRDLDHVRIDFCLREGSAKPTCRTKRQAI